MSSIIKDKCLDLSVIPQFSANCWFNAILTIALYSQGVRQILLKQAKTWDKSNQFLMILKSILVKYYNQPEKTQEFFNKIRPEIILLKIIRDLKNNADFITSYKKIFKSSDYDKYSNLGWSSDIIINFFRYIGVNCMDIFYLDNQYILNLYKFINKTYNPEYNSFHYALLKDFSKEKLIDDGNNSLTNMPDIIILFNPDLNDIDNFYYNYLNKFYNLNNLKYKNFNPNGINTFQDEIEINGIKYKLDSCLLDNYNYQLANHSIAGITCNGNRYVYNGWNRQSSDPAIISGNSLNLSPCSLMKYHWDLKKDESFCLNPKTCKLDFLKDMEDHDLCFSFANGIKYLVYIRINDKSKDYETSQLSIPSSLNLEDVSSVIKEIADVKNLTNDELINEINKIIFYLAKLDFQLRYDSEILKQIYLEELEKSKLSIPDDIHLLNDNQLKEKIEKLIYNYFKVDYHLSNKTHKELENIYSTLLKKNYNYNKKIQQSPIYYSAKSKSSVYYSANS